MATKLGFGLRISLAAYRDFVASRKRIFAIEPLENRILFSVTFTNLSDNPNVPAPVAVVASKFNQDDFDDLASVGGAETSTVNILLNSGTATFPTTLSLPVGLDPMALATADFNADSTPDIVVANSGSNTVSVISSHGDGTFSPKVDYPAGVDPTFVTTADLNGDGRPDIIVGSNSSERFTISVLINKGNGTFFPKVDYAAGTAPREIAVGDFDHDGSLDLAVETSIVNLTFLGNNGDGTFAPKVDFGLGFRPTSIVAADLNGDGYSDLAVLDSAGSHLVTLMNTQNDTFTTADYATNLAPSHIAVGDFDGNGTKDLVVTTQNAGNVSFYSNDGSGALSAKVDFATSQIPAWISANDVNDDGRTDMVIAEPTLTPAVDILTNTTAPVNDQFGAATTLSSYTATGVLPEAKQYMAAAATGTDAGAGFQSGEPDHAGLTATHSVWFNWTSPIDQTVSVDTFGSEIATTVAVYTGSVITSLTPVAGDSSANLDGTEFSFSATQGTVYRIAVDSSTAATGKFNLEIQTATSIVDDFFNPAYYLMHNPDVAAAIAKGSFTYAVEHFFQFGQFEGRQPSPDFNEATYLADNPDVRAAVNAGEFKDGYQHYLAVGFAEGRKANGVPDPITRSAADPQSYFDSTYYLANNPDVLAAVRERTVASGWIQFEDFGQYEGRQPSAAFNSTYYLQANPDVADAIDAGTVKSAFQHFIDFGIAESRPGTGYFLQTPVSGDARTFFDADYYLANNPDVLAALKAGTIVSAYDQFIEFGQFEGRQPSPLFDEAFYLANNPDVRTAVSHGEFKDGFEHFVELGFAEGRAGV